MGLGLLVWVWDFWFGFGTFGLGLGLGLFLINRLLFPLPMQDRIRYCISAYNRTLNGGNITFDKSLWDTLSTAAQRVTAAMILQILMEGTYTLLKDHTHSLYDMFYIIF